MSRSSQLGPAPLKRDRKLALWRQVHADLLRRVDLGEFADEFPGELALVEQYGVSRHTIREALRGLREAGIVTAARGRTPRLASPVEFDQPLGSLYSLFVAVQAAGLPQTSQVLALDHRRDAAVATRLGLSVTTELFYLERVRIAGDAPLAIDRAWMPLALAHPLLEADFRDTALYIELSARCGIRLDAGTENIRAVLPTPLERAQLELPDGEAALAISRLGHHGSQPVEWRHTLVRGDRFAVHADLSPAAGYRLVTDLSSPPEDEPDSGLTRDQSNQPG